MAEEIKTQTPDASKPIKPPADPKVAAEAVEAKSEAAKPADLPGKPEPAKAPTLDAATVEAMTTAFAIANKGNAHATATPGLSSTIPGGRYHVRGRLVNAQNQEIDGDGKLKYPELAKAGIWGF